MTRPSLTLGIEEEYLVIDPESRDLVAEPAPAFFAACREALGDRVSPELLQCQVEVGTRPHASVAAAVGELRDLRRTIAAVAEAHGYAVIAVSIHPFGRWRQQVRTEKERYEKLWEAMGQPGRRMVICGMHMHAGIGDDEMRIALMNEVAGFLPVLLALSASSPFWQGQDSDMASYRLAVYDELPRTGPPDRMASFSAYRGLVDQLVAAGCIEDGTKIWWDVRPSWRYPTLEQRVTDVCPRLADVAALAALYQALLGWLCRISARGFCLREVGPTLLRENRWLAQRHGSAAALIGPGRSDRAALSQIVEELLVLLDEDAVALGCRAELEGLRRIAAEGSSATRQRQVRDRLREAGADDAAALRGVVDSLRAEFAAE